MRPTNKSRSRNKNNRRNNNNAGNSLNRVYDSAGPQGRVRGTPAQVIEKYQSLAHDSSLAGDRVATENFQQHAEHYIRLINEAQRQNAERREAQEAAAAEQRQNNANNQNGGGGQPQPQAERAPDPAQQPQPDAAVNGALETVAEGGDGGLVETPEESARPPRNSSRRSRPTRKAPEDAAPKPAE